MRKDTTISRMSLMRGFLVLTMLASHALIACRTDNKDATAQTSEAPLTLDPAQFQGDTKQAYTVAREHPELLAQMDCYCGCEQHEGHKNLLTCFRTTHGAGCDTCTGEAIAAGKMAEGGMPVDQIRAALKERYAHDSNG